MTYGDNEPFFTFQEKRHIRDFIIQSYAIRKKCLQSSGDSEIDSNQSGDTMHNEPNKKQKNSK